VLLLSACEVSEEQRPEYCHEYEDELRPPKALMVEIWNGTEEPIFLTPPVLCTPSYVRVDSLLSLTSPGTWPLDQCHRTCEDFMAGVCWCDDV